MRSVIPLQLMSPAVEKDGDQKIQTENKTCSQILIPLPKEKKVATFGASVLFQKLILGFCFSIFYLPQELDTFLTVSSSNIPAPLADLRSRSVSSNSEKI